MPNAGADAGDDDSGKPEDKTDGEEKADKTLLKETLAAMLDYDLSLCAREDNKRDAKVDNSGENAQ